MVDAIMVPFASIAARMATPDTPERAESRIGPQSVDGPSVRRSNAIWLSVVSTALVVRVKWSLRMNARSSARRWPSSSAALRWNTRLAVSTDVKMKKTQTNNRRTDARSRFELRLRGINDAISQAAIRVSATLGLTGGTRYTGIAGQL